MIVWFRIDRLRRGFLKYCYDPSQRDQYVGSVIRNYEMQRSRWFAVVIVLLVGIGGICGCGELGLPPQSEWTKVTSDDGRVSALFPRPPRTQIETVDTSIGKLIIKITIYEAENSAFLINHMTYPLDPSQYDVDAGLAGAAQGAAQNVKGTILEDDDLEAFGFPGKSLLISTPDGAFVRGRIFIDPAGPTLFQAQVVGTRAAVDGSDTAVFLDSLTIK